MCIRDSTLDSADTWTSVPSTQTMDVYKHKNIIDNINIPRISDATASTIQELNATDTIKYKNA